MLTIYSRTHVALGAILVLTTLYLLGVAQNAYCFQNEPGDFGG